KLLFFYRDGQYKIYNEEGQLTYNPMEVLISIIGDPNIVLETLTDHSSYMKNKPLKKKQIVNLCRKYIRTF
ncbi:uncharacterized protein BX663DRAFT_444391, partial [Cokeromyces recurvatus]|uniref:uncharacterized protein n=1 Tax=Cokeromyces recurvatus TaxID=90255 RepID=UPI00221E59E6